MALPDLIQEEHFSQRIEDTLVVQAQWPLLQSMTDPTALSVPNAPIVNVLIASLWVGHLLTLPNLPNLQSASTLNVLLWSLVMYLPVTADPGTRLVTTEDREIRDRNLPRELLTFHRHQHRWCERRKRHADSLLTPIRSLPARTLVLSPRRSKSVRSRHRLDLQQLEADVEVVALMCLLSLLPVICSSLRAVLDEPSIRKCKTRIMGAWALHQNFLQVLL
jgi:hypothetical protein